MPDLIDRMCLHGRIWCPEGCHDRIPDYDAPTGVELIADLLENYMDDQGWMTSEFFAQLDPTTGHDGLDEAVVTSLITI